MHCPIPQTLTGSAALGPERHGDPAPLLGAPRAASWGAAGLWGGQPHARLFPAPLGFSGVDTAGVFFTLSSLSQLAGPLAVILSPLTPAFWPIPNGSPFTHCRMSLFPSTPVPLNTHPQPCVSPLSLSLCLAQRWSSCVLCVSTSVSLFSVSLGSPSLLLFLSFSLCVSVSGSFSLSVAHCLCIFWFFISLSLCFSVLSLTSSLCASVFFLSLPPCLSLAPSLLIFSEAQQLGPVPDERGSVSRMENTAHGGLMFLPHHQLSFHFGIPESGQNRFLEKGPRAMAEATQPRWALEKAGLTTAAHNMLGFLWRSAS